MKYNTTSSMSAAMSNNTSTPNSGNVYENILLLQMVILGSLAIVGVGGNVIILITGVKRRTSASDLRLQQGYRTMFITNLAIADILILVYGVPFYLVQEKMVPMSDFVCRFLVPLRDVLALASILTIMAISVERAVAVVSPFSVETAYQYAKYWIIVIWIVAYLLAGLPMVFVMASSRGNVCEQKWSNKELEKAHLTSAALLIVIPGLVTTMCYGFCLRSLHKFRQRRKNSSESTGIQQWAFIKQTRIVSRIAVVLVGVFWLCNLPLVIYAICLKYRAISLSMMHLSYVEAVLISLFFGASVINPVVLIVMSPLYRRSAIACLQKVPCRKGILKCMSKKQLSGGSTDRSQNISIANNSKSEESNRMALVARKQSVGAE